MEADSQILDSTEQVVVFSLEEQRYALPLHTVERVLPMVWISPLPKAPVVVVGVVNVHGQILPTLDIRSRFGLPAREWGPDDRLVVVRLSRSSIALPVDEVLGVFDVDVRESRTEPWLQSDVRPLSGIVSLPDGLLYLCNLESFLSLSEEHQLSAALEKAEP